MKNTVAITFCLLFIITNPAAGQSYYFKHYQVENGLSNSSVYCSTQDKKGFMWMGTKDGLNRFDGYNFRVFRSDPDDTLSLGDNVIHSLYTDDNGTLYIGTHNGLYRYDALAENFTVVGQHAKPVNETSERNNIRAITKDNQGNLWFVNGLTLNSYNEKTKILQAYDPQKYFEATSVCLGDDGTVWASTANGLMEKYDALHNRFTAYDVYAKTAGATTRWIEKIYTTGHHSILIGTSNHGVKLFNLGDFNYQDILTYNPDKTDIFARDFVRHSKDEYWIATESGIFVYNIVSGLFTNLRKKYNDPYSISDNAVYSLCRDSEGGIWAGTYFGGINYYPQQFTPFEKKFPDYSNNSLSGNAVREICQDKNNMLWIGTEDAGINKLNLTNNVFTHYLPTGKKTDIAYSNIHGLLATGNELWIGTFEHGLDIMDIKTGVVIRHYAARNSPDALHSNFIVTFCQTRSGTIFIGTTAGLFFYNKSGDNFTQVQGIPGNYFIYNLLEDTDGTIWAATLGNGLCYYNPATKKSGDFKYEPGNKFSLSNNLVNNVYQDSKGFLWVGTEGGGLCKFNFSDSTFKRYNPKNGFPSTTVFKILEDSKATLWITTPNGLINFNPATEKMKVYTKENGLLSDQFNYNSGYKDAAGKMYFGSVKGLVSFNPDNFISDTFKPPVYITGMQVNDKDLVIGKESPLHQSISYTARLTLAYDQSSFSVDFAALSFTAPVVTRYMYKMEGLNNKGWTFLKTNRRVYFTNLSPGKYIFKVKAANSSGIWNDKVTTLTINILPPFWKSTWAYLLYALLTALVIYYLVNTYLSKTAEKNKRRIEHLEHEKEKEIYEAKIEFFTNVAHEIKTPLTLIKAPLEKLINKPGHAPETAAYLKMIEKNTDRLINLTSQLLDFRKTEAKGFSLTFAKTDITELLTDTFTSFKPIADQKNIEFTIGLPADRLFAYADAEALIKIFSNLVNNAIKYACSKVHIQLLPYTSEDKQFTLEIKNDGYLVPLTMKEKIFEPFFRMKETQKFAGSGIGLSLSRSLAQLHKGMLTLHRHENNQNVFVLVLPINQNDKV